MKVLVCLLPVFLCFACKGQISNEITLGKIEKIYSPTLEEERRIWIYNPGNQKSKDRYPVLYLLDAEDHFLSTVGMIKQMNGRWPQMIVVGITNINRTRDLTPSSATLSGDSNKFMGFIEKELIPHIDSLYPTAPYRVFSGHSLGGLTIILYTLFLIIPLYSTPTLP